jgi:hypothetical protein
MNSIEAIYSGGEFRPLGEVAIAENQRVRSTIESSAAPFQADSHFSTPSSATDVLWRFWPTPRFTPLHKSVVPVSVHFLAETMDNACLNAL